MNNGSNSQVINGVITDWKFFVPRELKEELNKNYEDIQTLKEELKSRYEEYMTETNKDLLKLIQEQANAIREEITYAYNERDQIKVIIDRERQIAWERHLEKKNKYTFTSNLIENKNKKKKKVKKNVVETPKKNGKKK